jgi:hypothetical protein
MNLPALKLKPASAVLRVPAKELQNLVQFGVVKPKRRAGVYVFNLTNLVEARLAYYFKANLGTRTERLSELTAAFAERAERLIAERPDSIVFKLRQEQAGEVEVKVPFRELLEDLEQRLRLADVYKDLPRGPKRAGWKKEFLKSLREASEELQDVSEAEILRTIRACRNLKRKTQITVVSEA